MDTFLAVLSDMHTGSSRALWLNHEKTLRHDIVVNPNSTQKRMYEHFIQCAEYVKAQRQGKRLVIVHNGDAIDGNHHNTPELITRNELEQVEAHVELMETFLKIVDYNKSQGDKLFYTLGTEVHTGEMEREVIERLNAERASEADPTFDHIELNISNRKIWFLHHGVNAGYGPNKADALRNFGKRVFWESLNQNVQPPDLIYSSHTHSPAYNTYVQNYHTIHCEITPSWQSKTRYAKKVATLDKNKVGMSFSQISENGGIQVLPPLTIDTEAVVKIRL